MTQLLFATSTNALQKTLAAQLDQGTTASATLNNTTGIQNKPGVMLIDRVDSSGNLKSSSNWEWVIFQGTSGSTVTTLTRGVGGSNDQDHAVNAIVEFVMDVSWANAVTEALGNVVDVTDLSVDTDKIVTPGGTQTLTNKTLTAPQIGGDADLDDATGNITVQGADPWRTIALPAAAWSPTTTAGCAAVATVEAGTNDVDYRVLAFDASSDENAFINFQMPDSWDAGVIQFRYVWTNAGGGAAETVTFELSARAYADSDAIDQAIGTPVEVADTWLAQGDIHLSAWSGDVTVAGTPAAGQWVHFELMRDVSEDNLTGDARLIEVQIRYKQAKYSD